MIMDLTDFEAKQINYRLCEIGEKGNKQANAILKLLGGRPPAERRVILEHHISQLTKLLTPLLEKPADVGL